MERSIKTARLESVRGRLIKNISRGFKQRVGIAQALIHDPRILILDEPTASLTIDEVKTLFRLLRQFAQQGMAIIFVSHHLYEVFEITPAIAQAIEKGLPTTKLREIALREGLVELASAGMEQVLAGKTRCDSLTITSSSEIFS